MSRIGAWRGLLGPRRASRLPPLPVFPEPTRRDVERSRHTLERLLHENILPFWLPGALDREAGGYRLNHDLEGRWQGPASKCLVTQARTFWFFARLARSPAATAELRTAAAHGWRFLRERMWDGLHGGFFWEVDAAGREASGPDKHLYGQSFGLYALAEYAIASGDAGAEQLARRLFELLEERAHDARHGGYRECFDRGWSPLRDGAKGRLGAAAALKLMNTHLHLLESITRYFVLTGDALARERVIELVGVLGHGMARGESGVCTDQHRRDWKPLRGSRHDRVSYGHQLEGVWLMAEACRAVGLSVAPFEGLLRSRFEHALRFGFDRERGGFFESGPLSAPADRRTKLWWVQAEALVAALEMHSSTGESVPLGCFLATLEWIVSRQADWEHGDWHAEVSPVTGRPSGDKAGPWKSPYHDGRAVLQCLEGLASLADA